MRWSPSLDVTVAGASVARQALDAGLLDVIDISLVPVVLGAGFPWYAGSQGPVRLSTRSCTRRTA